MQRRNILSWLRPKPHPICTGSQALCSWSPRDLEPTQPPWVPDLPPAFQVLLNDLHHGPSLQVHFILVTRRVRVDD